MKRCAIIDDYQGCALDMADWNALAPDVEVEAFRDHLCRRGRARPAPRRVRDRLRDA